MSVVIKMRLRHIKCSWECNKRVRHMPHIEEALDSITNTKERDRDRDTETRRKKTGRNHHLQEKKGSLRRN